MTLYLVPSAILNLSCFCFNILDYSSMWILRALLQLNQTYSPHSGLFQGYFSSCLYYVFVGKYVTKILTPSHEEKVFLFSGT